MESEVEGKQVPDRSCSPYGSGKSFKFHSKVNKMLRKSFKQERGMIPLLCEQWIIRGVESQTSIRR